MHQVLLWWSVFVVKRIIHGHSSVLYPHFLLVAIFWVALLKLVQNALLDVNFLPLLALHVHVGLLGKLQIDFGVHGPGIKLGKLLFAFLVLVDDVEWNDYLAAPIIDHLGQHVHILLLMLLIRERILISALVLIHCLVSKVAGMNDLTAINPLTTICSPPCLRKLTLILPIVLVRITLSHLQFKQFLCSCFITSQV